MKITKHITIEEEHKEWLEKNAINLSKFVRNKINEEMRNANN